MLARSGGQAARLLAVLLVLPGCAGEEGQDLDVDAPETITVTTAAFSDGESVPARFTCDGADVAPPLAWDGVPEKAGAVALVVDDPDAPRGTFTHWVVLDIPVDVTANDEADVPEGGVEAQNSAGRASYFGPCPPSGTHRYRFTVYALRSPTGLGADVTLERALQAVEERVVAWGRLTGTYSRER
jgi:Raf kinase inhibitor-like YbhB/YbcL family protein